MEAVVLEMYFPASGFGPYLLIDRIWTQKHKYWRCNVLPPPSYRT